MSASVDDGRKKTPFFKGGIFGAEITVAAELDTSEVTLGREEKQRTGGKYPSPPQEGDNERQKQRPLSLWS